ncbi:cytochrome P450 3A14-like [Daphnia carinata]|uniref:cytochrome P450 3A14-like n=1 Tax=Daphnia carinata TaxID=120202 RepID=UPI00257F255A|nr:cytochrome P450 3A14-like [Daphnia carinata]
MIFRKWLNGTLKFWEARDYVLSHRWHAAEVSLLNSSHLFWLCNDVLKILHRHKVKLAIFYWTAELVQVTLADNITKRVICLIRSFVGEILFGMDVLEIFSSPATWAVTAVSCLYFAYRYATSTFNYFSDQGISGPKPIPIFGNMWGVWKANLPDYDMAMVKKHGKVFGYFDGPVPNLWITDADLIKAMFVKDFDHFVDRRSFELKTKVMRKWLSLMKGQEWKDIRSSVTPAFTTGKIKRMSGLIKECVAKLCDRLTTFTETDGKIDAKLTFSAFTMDVIARCAFGLKIDSLGNKDDPFIQNAQFVFNPQTNKSPAILLPFMYPDLFTMFGRFTERMFVTKQLKFFFKLLEDVLADRLQSKQQYHDFIEVADEAISAFTKVVDGKTVPMWSREIIDEIIMGQSTLFMLAGFDTTATTLTNTCFQLAKNPDVQEALYDSIVAKMEDYDDVSHEMVQDMPYLEMVIQEVLRFYPPLVRIERQCTKDYSYDNGRIKIKKGQIVTVPTYALHHMEEYYPDPEKFDPDRWTPENKAKRSPYTYMAFGTGPRNCVGMRFAMEELKIAVCTMVQKFRFFPVAETPDKLRFDDGFVTILQPIHAIVGVEYRGNSN